MGYTPLGIFVEHDSRKQTSRRKEKTMQNFRGWSDAIIGSVGAGLPKSMTSLFPTFRFFAASRLLDFFLCFSFPTGGYCICPYHFNVSVEVIRSVILHLDQLDRCCQPPNPLASIGLSDQLTFAYPYFVYTPIPPKSILQAQLWLKSMIQQACKLLSTKSLSLCLNLFFFFFNSSYRLRLL